MKTPIFVASWLLLIAGGCSRTAAPPTEAASTVEAPPATPQSEEQTPTSDAIDWGAFESTSLRNPNDGALVGGVPLPLTGPGLQFNPERDPRARYGTVQMVRGLVHAAGKVAGELGGLPVTINDLSYENGGPIPHHGSHQNGRDVDVFFYQLGPDGEPIQSVGAFFDPRGIGIDFRDLADPTDDVELRLDVPRTWRFVQALIEDEDAHLQRIFLAEHLRALLLDYARTLDVSPQTLTRFAEMSCQPGYPHDDHFHFRFFCAPDDIEAGCRDSDPVYPWWRKQLSDQGIEPLAVLPKRRRARTKIVTHEEARRAAGPMDAEVERWLDRREEWLDQPHPGRPYCP